MIKRDEVMALAFRVATLDQSIDNPGGRAAKMLMELLMERDRALHSLAQATDLLTEAFDKLAALQQKTPPQ